MDMLTVILIALGLSMDAVAVAIGMGLSINSLQIRQGFVIGLFFGSFQALMPVAGWLAGRSLRSVMMSVDHWVAFGLLVIVGAKMIYESLRDKSGEDGSRMFNMRSLVTLSVATSIDAFAIGISFAMLKISIVSPVLIIGVTTFLLSFLGVGLGKHAGHLMPKKFEIVGGVILIGIGFRILAEHIDFF